MRVISKKRKCNKFTTPFIVIVPTFLWEILYPRGPSLEMLASHWLDPHALLLTWNGSKTEFNPSLSQKRQWSTFVVMEDITKHAVKHKSTKEYFQNCSMHNISQFYIWSYNRQKPTFLLNGFNLRGGHHTNMLKVKPFYKFEFYNKA